MKRLKVGQIGIGHNHAEGKLRTARKFPELFEIIGYAEDNEKWIKERGRLETYRDLPRLSVDEIIDKSDIVFIECDVWNLTETAEKAVKKGKHIHMDKPASGSVEEYKRVLDMAKEKNLVVQLGYMYRYNPAIKKCIEMVKNGELGEIFEINAEMSTLHGADYRKWLKNFSGGIMYILGSHLVDLIVYMLGEPKRIVPFLKRTGLDGVQVEDNNLVVLEYEKAVAKVSVSSVQYNGYGRRQFVVAGSKGTVEIKPIENPTIMTLANAEISKSAYEDMKEIVELDGISHDNRYDEMMQDLYAYVMGTKINPYDYEHELLVHKVLTEIVGGMEENGKNTD